MVFFYHKEQKMRLTDDRYAGERSQFELALRMIRHEARTRTIRECTGLSDDRIRKLYARYFRNSGHANIKRRRGKSPRQVQRYVKNAVNRALRKRAPYSIDHRVILPDGSERIVHEQAEAISIAVFVCH